MKKLFIFFCALFIANCYAQGTVYKYYLHLSDYKNAHLFRKVNGKMIYSGKDVADKTFFDQYDILEYRQSFKDGIDLKVLNIFYMETTNERFINELKNRFSTIYLSSEDVSNLVFQTLADFYPNDYGSSSPFTNLGFNHNRVAWDYLHLPKAWGVDSGNSTGHTTGNPIIKIGISDTPIYYTDPDFLGKTTPVNGYTQSLSQNSHGTAVAATAAARGDNAYGSAVVCMDCDIVESNYGGISNGPDITYSNLYKMAQKGARVINMSWTNSGYTNNSKSFINAEQLVINDLSNNYHITLVAAAGNHPSFGTTTSNLYGFPYGVIYVFPASYDNVISVASICHRGSYTLPLSNAQSSYDSSIIAPFPAYSELQDAVAITSNGLDPNNPIAVLKTGTYISSTNIDGFQDNFTYNDKVDVLAPGRGVFCHARIVPGAWGAENPIDSGSSYSSPTVAGTAGLMLSVNDCLLPLEIEDIIQLSTKDIEVLPLNQNFTPANLSVYGLPGYLGAGKLEIGDTIEFTNEIKKINGNAVIDNHIFNRFEFNLSKINNKLTIDNVTFKDNCIADFTAKNEIRVLPGSIFAPNNNGYTRLRINPSIDITCTPIVFPKKAENSLKDIPTQNIINAVLYPNPNKGSFKISFNREGLKEVSIEVYDLFGKSVYNATSNESTIDIDVPNLQSGMYIVKLSNNDYSEVLKFVKE